MKNIHLLPTDKPSRLILQNTKLLLSKYKEVNEGFSEFNQNIYITSDEEIKEGDWILDNLIANKKPIIVTKELLEDGLLKEDKKIILTTDQDLIKDGVQSINDEFLEWFVKNPSCEFVEVESFIRYNPIVYQIILPKPKQETRKNRLLEELVEDIKNKQSFLKSIRKNPQLYYYKFGTCIYERLYNNNNCFEMQDPYGGKSTKMEKELIELKAEKVYYE